MKKILTTWLGKTDIDASKGIQKAGLGPIGQAATKREFDIIALISNYPKSENSDYTKWLEKMTSAAIELYYERLSSPTNFEEIYHADVRTVNEVIKRHGPRIKLAFHISPGTPAMQAIWIILAKTRFDAELIESSKEAGVQTAIVPFDISAEFIPKLLKKPDEELERLSVGQPPPAAEFANIIYRSSIMQRLIEMAQRVALSSFSVLIEGESGTGKELFARAIHKVSPRSNKPLIPVNCGAIPRELVESELFGYVKGAFTGADKDRAGYFEQADGGTIFLDEIGELPLIAQVKLLRVIQEQEVTRVGDRLPKKIDVRIIAATNRNLRTEVLQERFREDLYYRLAIIILQIPPLRERLGDVGLLIDELFKQIKKESGVELGFERKVLSPSAKNLLLQHDWPGNVRELRNVLVKAAFWAKEEKIDIGIVRDVLSQTLKKDSREILNRKLDDGFNLEGIIAQVASHYLKRAMEETQGNKTEAAKLLGLPSYQTFTNWMKRYSIDNDIGII